MFTQPHWKQVWFQHSLQKSAANFFLQHIELATSKIPHAKAMEGPKTIYSAKGLLHAFAIGTGWKAEEKKKMKRREKLKKRREKECASPHTKSSLISEESTVPLLNTQWKNKVQVLKALGKTGLPQSIEREKPYRTMITQQRTHTNLPEAYFLTVPHLLEVPEEGLVTFLTGVTV